MRKQFSQDPAKIRGYKSPNYFPHPLAPFRIRATLPDVKLVLLLREPVSRAVSAHSMGCENKKEKRSVDTALNEELVALQNCLAEAARRRGPRISCMWDKFYPSWDSPTGLSVDSWKGMASGRDGSYLMPSLYVLQLRHWMRSFPLSQFHITSSNAFKTDTKDEMLRLATFLGSQQHRVNEQVLESQHRTKKGGSAKKQAAGQLRDSTMQALRAFFDPFNQELWELMGRRLQW